MTQHRDIIDKTHDFAIMAKANALPVDIPDIEAIIAAILSDKHALSAEDLLAFAKSLLDAPDMDAGKRQELLQAIWNVVVSIIDFQWEAKCLSGSHCSEVSGEKSPCGQVPEGQT